MKILVNALPLRRGGGVSYLEQQLAALARVSPSLELHTLVSPWGQIGKLPGSVEIVALRYVSTRFLYEQVRLPLRAFDLLYCPANFGPVVGQQPMVLTLHNAHYYRSGLRLDETKHLRPWWKVKANHLAMKRADAVIAISRSEAEDAIATVPAVAPKLHVIHSAAPDWPAKSIRPGGIPDDYVLTVANSAAHKRTTDVVEGWARSLGGTSRKLPLVIVGSTTREQEKQFRRLAGEHTPLLRLTGPLLDRSRLRWVYENARALVSMSLLESFGLTPVEGASVGCPLILSDIPAHREVTQEHACFVPPGNTAALAQTLASSVYKGPSACSPLPWPVTWEDNARSLTRLFRLTTETAL